MLGKGVYGVKDMVDVVLRSDNRLGLGYVCEG